MSSSKLDEHDDVRKRSIGDAIGKVWPPPSAMPPKLGLSMAFDKVIEMSHDARGPWPRGRLDRLHASYGEATTLSPC